MFATQWTIKTLMKTVNLIGQGKAPNLSFT